MVMVTAAAGAAARHHVRRQHTTHSHDGWLARQSSSSTAEWASETTIDNIRPGVIRSNSRWFLDDLKSRLTENQSQQTKPRHWLVDSFMFQAAVSAIVVINTVQIGLAVDVRHGHWESIWRGIDILFAILFGLEMLVKIIAMRFGYFKEAWNLLDFFLAWLAIIEVTIVAISEGNAGMAGKLTVLRILRLFRLLRILRLFHMFKELVILMSVMVDSLRTLAWLLILVGLVLYVAAILCVELVGSDTSYPSYSNEGSDLHASAVGFNNFQYFGTVMRSMYSLFSLVTLSEFSTLTRPISEHQPAVLLVLLAFTMLTAYGVMNVLVGVMVEHALKANSDFEELKASRHKDAQMEMIITLASKLANHAADVSGKPDITPETLRVALSNSNKLADMITRIDLPSNCNMRELFLLIDDDGDGSISQDEFETAMYRLLYCGEFQRSCIVQISLNTLKQGLAVVQADLEAMRMESRHRCSADSSLEQVQPDLEGCARAKIQEEHPRAENTARVAVADELLALRTELQEMRFELGARLAELGPRWQSLQGTKRKVAPQMPRMGSAQTEMDKAATNNAAMPAVLPGLPLQPPPGFSDGGAADTARASSAATLLRQLDDLVGGLEQHRSEQELATLLTETATETDGHALVRLRCANLISRLAQALATGGNRASGSSKASQMREEHKDEGDMPPNTWHTPEGGPPVPSVWAMESCCGNNRRPQPVRKL